MVFGQAQNLGPGSWKQIPRILGRRRHSEIVPCSASLLHMQIAVKMDLGSRLEGAGVLKWLSWIRGAPPQFGDIFLAHEPWPVKHPENEDSMVLKE